MASQIPIDNVNTSATDQPGDLQEWETIVAEKKERSKNNIPNDWKLPETIFSELSLPLESHPNRILDIDDPRKSGILSARELEITDKYSVAELLDRLASGTFTSLEVTTAFCKRAAIAQQLVSIKTSGEQRAV
jgi:amidase